MTGIRGDEATMGPDDADVIAPSPCRLVAFTG
jgi:hypothetical protein